MMASPSICERPCTCCASPVRTSAWPPLGLPPSHSRRPTPAPNPRFETFDVPGLHIGVQAVLALYASWAAAEHQDQASAFK